MFLRSLVTVVLALGLATAPTVLAADKNEKDEKVEQRATPKKLQTREVLKKATRLGGSTQASDEGQTAADRAKDAFQRGRAGQDEAADRKRVGETQVAPRARAESVRDAATSSGGQRGAPDPAAARKQWGDKLPIQPPQQKASPFDRPDPGTARKQALERARKRATQGLEEETVKLPDPYDRTLPARGGLPGTGPGTAESLKGVANRMPGASQQTNPYDAASIAKGKRPFFQLTHQGGGEGVWRCVKYCAENGFEEDELTDEASLPGNAVKDDVSDMTTTDRLCKENPKRCEEAGRNDRRPGENDEEYWDRKSKEAYAKRKERERKKRQEKANADCSKIKSRTAREDCEFQKKLAKKEEERRRKEAEKKKAEKKKDKTKDCAVAQGKDCDGLPDDALVDWHRQQQQQLLGATGYKRGTGPGNIDPERGPAWHAGLEERAVEILGVDDPPEDEHHSGNAPANADCTTAPGTGAIDYGPDHPGGGNPACETDTPQFDAGETLDLEQAKEGEGDEDEEAGK